MTLQLRNLLVRIVCMGAVIAFCKHPAQAQATRPTGEELDPLALVQRLRQNAKSIDLTDQQRTQLAQILDDAERQARLLEDELSGAGITEKIERTGPFLRDLRRDLAQVLPPDELRQLREPAAVTPNLDQAAGLILLGRIRSAVDHLDLNDDQKKQVTDLFADARNRIEQIRREQPAERRTDARQLITDFRDKLLGVLTPDQRQQLRELLDPGIRPPPEPAAVRPPLMPEKTHPTTAPVGVAIGSAAPEFEAQTTGGEPISLSSYAGRVLVLEFGSMSSPSFRDRVAGIQKLYQQYATRVAFVLVYTREAHPAGGWEVERNQDESIDVPQTKSMEERRRLADKVKESLHIGMTIVVDPMDDSVSDAYGGFPNATFVIGRDGRIVGRQQWTDPSGLQRVIEEALADK